MPEIFGHGAHVCGLYGSPEEQTSMAAEYFAEGRRAGERCVYIGESAYALKRLRAALTGLGVDPDPGPSRWLIELTQDQFYLPRGHFDVDATLARIEREIIAALDAGFTGLRGCGDMSWLLRGARGAEQVFEYERRINDFFRGRPVQALCQYDWKVLPAATIRRALITHPLSISR